jgi:ParB family chromosome partitioning protein
MARRAKTRETIASTLQARSDALFDLDGLPQLVEVDVAAVAVNPDQPRRTVTPEGIAELAQSIEQHGLLQPIVVRMSDPTHYVLVAGQRRLLAHRELGRTRIPALLTTGRPDELALIENLQREDLRPIEEAEALFGLKERYGYTQDQLAKAMAKAKSTISELLSLAGLPAAIKEEVRTSELPVSKSLLIEIARIGDAAEQLRLWQKLAKEPAATVQRARAAKRDGEVEPAPNAPAHRSGRRLLRALEPLDAAALDGDPELRALLEKLQTRLAGLLGPTAR